MPGVPAWIEAAERVARDRLDATVYDYYAGGSGEEVSLGEANAAWRRFRLRPQVLCDVSSVDASIEVLGATFASPIGVAPMASQGLLHADAEVATVRGATGHLSVISTRASAPLEEIAAEASAWWFQVYVTADRSVTANLVARATAAGAGALVLTGDTPFVAEKARIDRLAPVLAAADQSPAVTEAEIRRLGDESGLPVLVKGVLRGDDAKRCLDAGAAGIVVSNHGGRQLDRAVPSAFALAEVVAAADGAPVLVDGGVRSGVDVLIALALGARAVLVGRPVAWALVGAGTDGVRELLRHLDTDFRSALGLAGCRSCAEATSDLVVPW